MFDNEDLVKRLMLENAHKKSAKELIVLADNYYRGINVTKDLELAFKLTKMSAEKGLKLAQYNLAYMYLHGEGTTQNVDKTIEILAPMSKKGDIKALDQLSEIYASNKYGKQDVKIAVKYYQMGAKAGSKYCIFNLAKSYHEGIGIEIDYAQAKKYYELAAKKGLPDAYTNLGCMYEFGVGVEKDINKAIEYFKIAAEKGSVTALTNLGNAYFDGRGVEQNFEKAYECMVKGVEQNHPQAKYGLAYMYYKGKFVEHDIKKAFELFNEAAAQNEPQSNYMLGYMYNVGEGVEQDLQKAFEYYQTSAALGYEDAFSDIGTMYMQGRGVERDVDIANQFFIKGSDLGSNLAKCNLAASYVNGTGYEKDFQKAIDILKTINDDFNDKYYYLGVITHECINGLNKTKEVINEALEYYNKYIELTPDTQDTKYVSMVYYKMAEAYLDLYYLDEASTNNRNKEHFSKQNPNREKAKECLRLAKEKLLVLDEEALKILKSDINIAEDLLNDEGLDLSQFTYETFKEQFFGKLDNLFLLTNKKEFELFEDGVKYYFNKRETEKEIKQKLELEENNFEKRKSLIRKKLEEMQVENIDEKLEEIRLKNLEKSKNNMKVDFSTSVINIDKFLEDVLHYLFVDCLYDHKEALYKKIVAKNIEEIKELLKDCSTDTLKELNLILNGIDKSISLKQDVMTKKLEIFAEKFNKNWNWKSISEDKITDLKTYYDNEKDNLDPKETKLINKMLENSKARIEYAEMEKTEKFELGSLFYMAFTDANVAHGAVVQKIIDPAFLEFATSVKEDLSITEASLKLRELFIKVEMFRVIVRNVASHKSTLNQAAVEKGINISIVQENSIFKLLDEMFGDFLNQKYVEKIVSNLEI